MSDYASLTRSLQLRKPRGPDDPRVRYLKDDMCSWLQLATLISVFLTVFLTEMSLGRVPNPAQQMAHYLEQNVPAGSIAQEFSTSHSGSTPETDFGKSKILWALSLTFSITSAFFATVILRWIRGMLHS